MGRASIVIADADGETELSLDLVSEADPWLAAIDAAFPGAARIGLVIPPSVAGLCCWKGVLLSGRTPVLLPYPGAGLSRLYWQNEIEAAVSTLSLEGIIHSGGRADPGLPLPCLDISAVIPSAAHAIRQKLLGGRLIQLSCGPAGYCDGRELTLADVARDVDNYNKVLGLGRADCVVSGFPLHHPAGLLATVLLPLVTGARVVMVEPVTWERRPQLFYELIEKHRGTVCLLPNFGYEVMASRARADGVDLSSMRRWICCSALARPDTLRRFLDASRTPPEALSNCYSPAGHNVAVSQSAGFRTRKIDGQDVVSCGMPIAPATVEIVGGEIWVRSPGALPDGGDDPGSHGGHCPTGDLGELIEGELYVRGRKDDRLRSPGRKRLLTDLDRAAAEAMPGNAGRICTFERYSEMLGGDGVVCLIEADRFWAKNRDTALIGLLRRRLGVDMARIEFVPPGFITESLPGEPARAYTRDCYVKLEDFRRHGYSISRFDRRKVRQRILDLFPELQPDVALGRQIDSLGLANISILLEDAGIELSSEEIADFSLETLPTDASPVVSPGTGPVLRVVCWLDYERIDYEDICKLLTGLGRQLGIYVQCNFVVAPPAAAVLSDLVFEDYFMVRRGSFDIYNSVRTVLALFRNADVIVTDDILQLLFPRTEDEPQAYPAISHRFEPAELADFLAVRWSFYSEQHHLIATEAVVGSEQTGDRVNRSLDDIEDYLGVPIVRVAFAARNRPHTARWQVHCFDPRLDDFPVDRAAQDGVDGKALGGKLLPVLLDLAGRMKPRPGEAADKWITPGQAHFCGALVNPALVDFVLERYESFLVLGKPSSIPYLSKQALRLGKKLTFRSDLHCPPGDYDCVLQTGSFGEPETDKPVFQLMGAGWAPQARNVPDDVLRICPGWIWPKDRPIAGR